MGTRPNEYPQGKVFSKRKKNITIFHLKLSFLQPQKDCSILQGRVNVMKQKTSNKI